MTVLQWNNMSYAHTTKASLYDNHLYRNKCGHWSNFVFYEHLILFYVYDDTMICYFKAHCLSIASNS